MLNLFYLWCLNLIFVHNLYLVFVSVSYSCKIKHARAQLCGYLTQKHSFLNWTIADFLFVFDATIIYPLLLYLFERLPIIIGQTLNAMHFLRIYCRVKRKLTAVHCGLLRLFVFSVYAFEKRLRKILGNW